MRGSPARPATGHRSAVPETGLHGASLIEVLVSVVVFSMGMLAVAALQLQARHGVHEAAQRTVAARLAQDILERMRANNHRGSLAAVVRHTSPWPERWAGRNRLAATLGDPGCSGAGPCTAAQATLRDLRDWERFLDGAPEQADGLAVGGLLYPTACISGPADGESGLYTVAIAWRGRLALPADPDARCGREAAATGAVAPPGTRLYGEHDQWRRQVSVAAYIVARE